MSELTVMRGSLGRLRKWIRATREEGLGPMGTDLDTLRGIADVLEADISELEDDLNTAELDNEHLREQLNEYDGDCYCGLTVVGWYNHSVLLQERLDEVERTHMRLPVDADGVLCRIGDVLEWDGGRNEVMAVSDDCVWFDTDAHELRLTCFESSGCRHVQPRTLEDIIYEIALDSVEIVKVVNGTPVLGIDRGQLAEELEIYADEIREITKGGGA